MNGPAHAETAQEPDNGQRRFLRGVLRDAAARFDVRVDAGVDGSGMVFSWRDRSLGCRVLEGTGSSATVLWLRVTYERFEWTSGEHWTGNVDANALTGVPKPLVLRWQEWDEDNGRNRAELMTYIDEPSCSATAEAGPGLGIPGTPWWASLRTSLARLADHPTDRVARSRDYTEHALRIFFGDRAPMPIRWATCHGDLHWANVTTTTPVLLDWEHWGQAPAGFDAAHLYCHSLAVPELAVTVHRELADVLETPDGRASQLLAIAGMLRRADNGDYPDLVLPLHRLAERLLDGPRS